MSYTVSCQNLNKPTHHALHTYKLIFVYDFMTPSTNNGVEDNEPTKKQNEFLQMRQCITTEYKNLIYSLIVRS